MTKCNCTSNSQRPYLNFSCLMQISIRYVIRGFVFIGHPTDWLKSYSKPKKKLHSNNTSSHDLMQCNPFAVRPTYLDKFKLIALSSLGQSLFQNAMHRRMPFPMSLILFFFVLRESQMKFSRIHFIGIRFCSAYSPVRSFVCRMHAVNHRYRLIVEQSTHVAFACGPHGQVQLSNDQNVVSKM